ncbi:prolyl oligopeptidase family serine peptidase [Skermania sp. ID1734]|uniref:alpha/beta hydrolase family protein n=1 Tax=Skermania sp. ID1734 TaxID=2597516 RepID=UPI00117FBA6B|nr:prolyl oligopeptidase family serine peptidase [Skermania sp. ID1734]TSE01953.1 prolyl oligopeptidase family serine peptidase [Skermania sp. ID1734]
MTSADLNGEKRTGSETDADPIPTVVPNVSGHDATANGLPSLRELSLRDRAIVSSSALADVGLRTGAASLIAGAIAPHALNPRTARRERADLAFYAELAREQNPELSFPRPTAQPKIRSRPANLVARAMTHGPVHTLSFESPFQPINPRLRRQWKSMTRNNVACAQYWRHPDGPRPTLCVIHGFLASPYLLNSMFFQLPWFYKSGFDVLLYTLPFHGARAHRLSPFSGYGYFSHGLSGFGEAMGQAVHDFRVFLDYLQAEGVTDVGLTGISLGGYTTALLAAVEDRLRVVMPNVPVVDVADLIESWFPASVLLDHGIRTAGVSADEYRAGVAYHSPLNYAPLVAKERRLIITGLGDRLAPPQQSEKLWLHWDRCALHWFPGNHILHVSQPDYLRRMTHFMRDNDFMPPQWRPAVA